MSRSRLQPGRARLSNDARTTPVSPISIIDACNDPNLFRSVFNDLRSWKRWFAFLKVVFNLPMTVEDFKIAEMCTQRERMPRQQPRDVFLVCGRRAGKALDIETPILTTVGYKKMGELVDGDMVYDADGNPTTVIYAHPVEQGRPCYEVEFSDHSTIVADAEHEWVTFTKTDRRLLSACYLVDALPQTTFQSKGYLKPKDRGSISFKYPISRGNNAISPRHLNWYAECSCGNGFILPSGLHIDECPDCYRRTVMGRTKTTKELYQTLKAGDESNHAIPVAPTIQYPRRDLPIDPYVLGAWLGDGHTDWGAITSADEEVVDRLRYAGHTVVKWSSSPYGYAIRKFKPKLAALGVLGNKHIPDQYLKSSREQRIELLRGLMDTDGSVERGTCVFYNTNRRLVEEVKELVIGLGVKIRADEYRALLNGKDCGPAFDVFFAPDFYAFHLERKKQKQDLDKAKRKTFGWRHITDVRLIESRPVRCITVANPDGLFLCGRENIITHNSFITALIAVFLAVFLDWTPLLSPGERGTIIIVASDRKQARVIMRYIKALLSISVFAPLVERETEELVELRGQVSIEIMTASFRGIRGYTVVAALLDEIAFWRSEDSSNPDTEILEAIRSGTSTIPGALIMGLSSPYARRGVLWDSWKRYFGTDSDTVLVWQAPTWVMNPTVPLDIINEAYERDPFKADAEYGANFRRDVELYVPQEVVEACTDVGIYERAPDQYIEYTAFCDPSGGSQDSFTLAIAHHDEKSDKNIVDLVRSTSPPFSPEDVVSEYVKDMKRYNIAEVFSDRYGGDWVSERFLKQGVLCTPAKKSKSIIYREMLPMLMSGKVQLLDAPVVNSQLISLERRTRQGGNDLIDHPPGSHDDSINAVAGSLVFIDQAIPIDMW